MKNRLRNWRSIIKRKDYNKTSWYRLNSPMNVLWLLQDTIGFFFFGLLWQFVGGMLCSWSNYFTLAVPLSVLEPTYLRLVVGIFLKKLLLTDLVFVFSKFLVASYSSPSLNETENEKFLSWWRWTDQATKYFETRKEDWLKELFLKKNASLNPGETAMD